MVRKYTRDNRGRFATTGATARGAGLKTAAGNKRASVRMDAPAAKRAGTVGTKAKPRSAATSRLRPGELMNANARPVSVISKPKRPRGHGYEDAPINLRVGSPERKAVVIANVKRARSELIKGKGEFGGIAIQGTGNFVAAYEIGSREKVGRYVINASAPSWVEPVYIARQSRRSGQMSTSDPRHVVRHEIGHAVHQQRTGKLNKPIGRAPAPAGRVSKYAKVNSAEFAAETYAGLKGGKKYDYQVMRAYRAEMGLPAKPPARRRSRLRKPK